MSDFTEDQLRALATLAGAPPQSEEADAARQQAREEMRPCRLMRAEAALREGGELPWWEIDECVLLAALLLGNLAVWSRWLA